MTTYAPFCDATDTGYLLLDGWVFREMDGSRFKRAWRPEWKQVELAELQTKLAAFRARVASANAGGMREYSERLNDGSGGEK